ncbi:sulfite exporter TauE/SafE family protein [Bradyrhizobium sp. Leo170]|nr:sulfite exporter TauE/SafE family protein [Bradyrhizobium sp. Leo170]
MDGSTFELPLFLLATFAGAFVAGLSGFAFGLVAASLWLYILAPLQSATLIVGFGLLVQGYSVWRLRRALDGGKLLPFIVGAALGVPTGVSLLTRSDPRTVRIAVGAFLAVYSLYGLLRPGLKPISTGASAIDTAVGFLNGVLGSLTGLAGILVTIWCGLRGWSKDLQRTIFQPVAVTTFLMSALWLGGKGTVTSETVKLFVMGLPCLLLGTLSDSRLTAATAIGLFDLWGCAIPPRGDMPKNRVRTSPRTPHVCHQLLISDSTFRPRSRFSRKLGTHLDRAPPRHQRCRAPGSRDLSRDTCSGACRVAPS